MAFEGIFYLPKRIIFIGKSSTDFNEAFIKYNDLQFLD